MDNNRNRGDSIRSIPNIPQILINSIFEKPQVFRWNDVITLSGWIPPETGRGYNAKVDSVRKRGFKTVGEICVAAAIPKTTFYRWQESGRLPKLEKIDGIAAIPESAMAEWVNQCRVLAQRAVSNSELN